MVFKNTTLYVLKNLWGELLPKRKIEFIAIFILTVVSAFAEMANIGAILSFLTALVSPEKFLGDPHLSSTLDFLNLKTPNQLLFAITIFFGLAALATNGLRLILVWFSTRVLYATGADLSIKAYRHILHQPYIEHVRRNSSEVLNAINRVEDIVRALNMSLNLVSCLILVVAIFFAVIFINPFVAFGSIFGFGIIYIVIIFITKNKILLNGRVVSSESSNTIKIIQEGLGGIRDILIDGTQEVFCRSYDEANLRVRRSQGNIEIIKASPRYFVESFGMLLILMLAYLIAVNSDSKDEVIPVLGALALASQRLLPLIQSAYTSWTGIRGVHASLVDSLVILRQPTQPQNKSISMVTFNSVIEFSNIEFKYEHEGVNILEDINLLVSKGDRIGVVGKTGGGKSTLMDILMGLLEPNSGMLMIDGICLNENNLPSWRAHIAHVPQAIYLSDNSIAQNIAFGVPAEEIDLTRVIFSAKQANIADVIESWPNQYSTIVGERGIRLSGGQRQRIGIARAIYKNADVIIFDEATSALDSETEYAVMNAINGLSKNLTIFIVAHRLSTLQGCNKIIELENGRLKRIISYEQMIKTANNPNNPNN